MVMMRGNKLRVLVCIVSWSFLLATMFVSAEGSLKMMKMEEVSRGTNVTNYSSSDKGYSHVWPGLKFGWKIVGGTIIGFLGAAFGSVGGVGGGGIFVPMLTLIEGFDPKSATAISKCMITGAAISTVYYNLKKRHPTKEMPIIDYDLALLIQPVLMLGISVGVTFNVVLAEWMITVLLIVLFIGLSTLAFLRGVATWKKETILKKEASQSIENGSGGGGGSHHNTSTQNSAKISIIGNVRWKECGLLCVVWVTFLALQISKNYTTTCSTVYWVINLLQIPICVGVSSFEAIGLYKGWKNISSISKSSSDSKSEFRAGQLIVLCFFGMVAGIVGALLGMGGGFIMGPLFLELGVPPEVSTATSTFVMMFTSSIAVVEYYLLKRFPIPYAVYLTGVATIAAFVGQHVVRKAIKLLGRASLIIFTLAFLIFVSAISLGGVGISNMVKRIQHHEYMGFQSLCNYKV